MSPIKPISFHPSQQSPSTKRLVSPGHNPGDLPSIVKRLSLTVSPVHVQLAALPAPASIVSIPSDGSPIRPSRRMSKNLSEIDWPSPTSTFPARRKSIVSPSVGSDRRVSLQNKRTSLIFSSPMSDLSSLATSTSSIRRRRASSILSTTSPAQYVPNSPTRLRSGSIAFKKEAESGQAKQKAEEEPVPGCHVSLVLRLYHGNKVPLSFVHQLMCADVPTMIMNLGRYLNRYGFAPHLSRENSPQGIKILGEEFNPTLGFYKLQYMVKQPASGEARIRFHGLTFTSGHAADRYEVTVMRASQWTLVYDQPSNNSSANKENARAEPRAPPACLLTDRAQLVSWRGGSTIVVGHPSSPVPVEVQIRKIGNLSSSLPTSVASAPLKLDFESSTLGSGKRVVLGGGLVAGCPELMVGGMDSVGGVIEEEV